MVIGIAAPASAFDPREFAAGVATLEALGFAVVEAEGIHERVGRFAGSDALRAAGVNRLMTDPGVDAVLCARGGYGSLRILAAIDYDAIRRRPKPLVGFSDATALLVALAARCRCPVVHGPMVTTLAGAAPESLQALAAALRGEGPESLPCEGGRPLRGGRAEGPVIGGNLTTLCHLLGTPFAPDCDGRILFLEERGEAPYRIDRMLTQMRLAGCFAGVRGLLLGRFSECGEAEEVERVVMDVLGDLPFPVLAGVAAGHGEPNLAIPFGVPALLDADAARVDFRRAAAG